MTGAIRRHAAAGIVGMPGGGDGVITAGKRRRALRWRPKRRRAMTCKQQRDDKEQKGHVGLLRRVAELDLIA